MENDYSIKRVFSDEYMFKSPQKKMKTEDFNYYLNKLPKPQKIEGAGLFGTSEKPTLFGLFGKQENISEPKKTTFSFGFNSNKNENEERKETNSPNELSNKIKAEPYTFSTEEPIVLGTYKDDNPIEWEKAWTVYSNRYMKTLSFCKFCNDRIFEYKNKLAFDEEIDSYMIQLPICKRCIVNNIDINSLHNERFGKKKKKTNEEK